MRYIVLYEPGKQRQIAPPVPGVVIRASDFSALSTTLPSLLSSDEPCQEIIVAGDYLSLISTASLFAPSAMVVALLVVSQAPLEQIREMLYSLSETVHLLFFQRFPHNLPQAISLLRKYQPENFLSLVRALEYDDLLVCHLFGTQPSVVQSLLIEEKSRVRGHLSQNEAI